MTITTPAEDMVFGLTRLLDLPGLTAATGTALGVEDIAAIIGEAERFTWSFAGARRLKGIKGEVKLFRARRA